MGHKREHCPYILQHDLPLRTAETIVEGELVEQSYEECDMDKDKAGRWTTESVPDSEHKVATGRGYGPWVVVNQKKNGTRNQKSGGPSATQDAGQPRQDQGRNGSVLKTNVVRGQDDSSSDSARETKRKLPPQRASHKWAFIR